MAIGNVQGLDYALPQQRYLGQQAAGAAPAGVAPQIGLPDLNDDYANVQGITDEFINTVGQLKSYTHDMAKKYKIDVTEPDYAQPGGGQPYRTFQELSAKAILTGKDLKKRMTDNQQIQKGVLDGTVLAQGDYENAPLDASIQERAVSTTLLPEVRQASEALLRSYDTRAGAQRANQTYKAPLVNKLTAAMEADPANAAFYQRQIDALPDATYEPVQFNPNTGGGAGKAEKKQSIIDLYRRTTNLIKGAFDADTYDTTIDENFEPVSTNTELSGTPLGKKAFVVKKQKKEYPLVIDAIVRRGDKMYIKYQQPEEAISDKFKIEDEEITGTKGDLFLKRLIQHNKGIGINTTELVTALREAGLYEGTGSKDDMVVEKDKIRSFGDSKKKIAEARAALKSDLKALPFNEDKAVEIITPNGQNVQVYKTSGRFNWNTPKYTVYVDGEETTDELTDVETENWLRENTDYFNSMVNESRIPSADPAPTKAPLTPEQIAKFEKLTGKKYVP